MNEVPLTATECLPYSLICLRHSYKADALLILFPDVPLLITLNSRRSSSFYWFYHLFLF